MKLIPFENRTWLAACLAAGLAVPAVAGDKAGVVSAGKIAKDAKKFYNQTVTVKAEVEDVIDGNTITLDEDATFAGPDVLVLLPDPGVTGLIKDQQVLVTGVVRPYVVADLEKEFTFFKGGKLMSREPKIEYETRPVLVASSITTADGRTVYGPVAQSGVPLARVAGLLTTADLVRDLATFGTRTVTVKAPVSALLDTYAFTLDENTSLAGPDVVVLVPGGMAAGLAAGDVITISGKVRPWVVADMERDFTFLKGGPVMSLQDINGRPVLVATSIKTSKGTEIVLTPR